MRNIFLKVKIESLAAEARFIRREIQLCVPTITYLRGKLEKKEATSAEEVRLIRTLETQGALDGHNRSMVRPEARATLIAYGYLRGRPYSCIESSAKSHPDWKKVRSMVTRYGGYQDKLNYDAWEKEAIDFIENNIKASEKKEAA